MTYCRTVTKLESFENTLNKKFNWLTNCDFFQKCKKSDGNQMFFHLEKIKKLYILDGRDLKSISVEKSIPSVSISTHP